MKCPKCHFDNPEVASFCVECGERLENKCPKCGFNNEQGLSQEYKNPKCDPG